MNAERALPLDPLLPQLAQALDGDAMAAQFDALLRPHGSHRVRSCRVERIKYRPRRNLAVAYRLALQGAASAEPIEQRVAVRFCVGGESARRFAKAAAGDPATASAVGLKCSQLPGLDMVAHWWPHDPKLGVAARIVSDAARLRAEALPALIAALAGEGAALLDHRATIAQLVPEQRVTARVELHLRGAAGASPVRQVVFAKAEAERRGAVTHAVMKALSNSRAGAQGRLRTPRALLWDERSCLHWQAALPGQALLDLEPAVGRATAARVGALLAALHAAPAPGARRVSYDALRQRVVMVASTLTLVHAPWGPALQRLGAQLCAGVDLLLGMPNVTLHGDLHPRNILVDGDELGLIDLDDVRQGPALLDVGDWIADATYRALLNGGDAADALAACRAFVAAYAGETGRAFDEAALAWSVAQSLLTQRAWRCVVNLKPGRFALVPSLLALAGALLRERSLDAAQAPWREAA